MSLCETHCSVNHVSCGCYVKVLHWVSADTRASCSEGDPWRVRRYNEQDLFLLLQRILDTAH